MVRKAREKLFLLREIDFSIITFSPNPIFRYIKFILCVSIIYLLSIIILKCLKITPIVKPKDKIPKINLYIVRTKDKIPKINPYSSTKGLNT